MSEKKKIIQTTQAPAAIGPYSQAVRIGGFLFCSGQIALNPLIGDMVEGGSAEQLQQALKNVEAIALATGFTLSSCIKLVVYVIDLQKNYSLINAAMATYFEEPYPARSVIGVESLPKGALVEVEAIFAEDGV